MPDIYANKSDGLIHVQYSHVANAAEDMRQQTAAIQNTVIALNQELSGLRAAWQGMDAATYQQKQAQWDDASKKLGEILARHSGLLDLISETYKRHEGNSANNWANVKVPGA